jgi:hypothetical protein
MIDAVDKITLYEKMFNGKPWDIVEEDLKLNSIIIETYFSDLSNKSMISKDDIRMVLIKMITDLKSML